jgi:hypothetical protein
MPKSMLITSRSSYRLVTTTGKRQAEQLSAF